ncbi:MAG TPA: hypothetical protein VF681_05815 [Abditibacteriaceae bacterium]|jgi:hypothetical protein
MARTAKFATRYSKKTEAELRYIMRDADEAARCAREMGNVANENKYRDQVNDAVTELHRRRNGTSVACGTGLVTCRQRGWI